MFIRFKSKILFCNSGKSLYVFTQSQLNDLFLKAPRQDRAHNWKLDRQLKSFILIHKPAKHISGSLMTKSYCPAEEPSAPIQYVVPSSQKYHFLTSPLKYVHLSNFRPSVTLVAGSSIVSFLTILHFKISEIISK